MREIKFRAWKKSENRMVGWRELCEKNILRDVLEGIYLESVMQFTGLYDKNGKEIYEGDIAKRSDNIEPIMEIRYYNGGFSFSRKRRSDAHDWPSDTDGYVHLLANLSNCEIIGNIHENPELLEGV